MKTKSQSRQARSAARLAVVQALYQMELSGIGLSDALSRFQKLGAIADDGVKLARADARHLESLLRGVIQNQVEVDRAIGRALREDWPMARLDNILRAILRSGTFELLYRPDIPGKVVINEYLDVAHAFFDAEQTRFINGVLDNIAQNARADGV